MKCVHRIRIDKPCPDCEYEWNCMQRGVKPENRWEDHPLNPANQKRERDDIPRSTNEQA